MWAALVAGLGLVVAAVGLLGPRTAPLPLTGPAIDRSAAVEILEPPARTYPHHEAIDIVARQVAGEVILDGKAPSEIGPLLVTLEFQGTQLAAAAVAPRDGMFEAVLHPRVPFGGLIGRIVVRASGDPTGRPAVDQPIILDRTTHGRRTVDPTTGRTLMAGLTP